MPNNIERFGYTTELFAEPDSRRINGYAIVFDMLSQDLGGFKTVIAPEAVDRTLQASADIRALVDHDSSKILGRTSAGTLRYSKDARGLNVSIDVPDTTFGNDLLVSVRRRDVSGMSFGTYVRKDEWNVKGDVPIRTIRDMDFFEVSIVTFPAFPDTTAALASLYEYQRQQGMPLALLERIHRLRIARG